MGLRPVSWTSSRVVSRVVRGDTRRVLHLHGHWEELESVVLRIQSYQEVSGNKHTRAVMQALDMTSSFLFVGCGQDGAGDPNWDSFLTCSKRTPSIDIIGSCVRTKSSRRADDDLHLFMALASRPLRRFLESCFRKLQNTFTRRGRHQRLRVPCRRRSSSICAAWRSEPKPWRWSGWAESAGRTADCGSVRPAANPARPLYAREKNRGFQEKRCRPRGRSRSYSGVSQVGGAGYARNRPAG